MEIPKFISEMSEEQIQDRIDEIDAEMADIQRLKNQQHFTVEDIENVSDDYQYRLEWNYALSELRDERALLIQARNALHTVGEDN